MYRQIIRKAAIVWIGSVAAFVAVLTGKGLYDEWGPYGLLGVIGFVVTAAALIFLVEDAGYGGPSNG